jgi:hypothetical protein
LIDSRELTRIRYPAAEPPGEARKNRSRRDHRDLLSDDLEDQGTKQVHRRQPPNPGIGVEIRTAVDQLSKHRVGRVQPGEPRANLLRARCHIAEVPNRSPA